jgi:hypothetical protein
MGAGAYVARIGGLAVALGIGAAVLVGQAHGFNSNLYQNWNMNRDWHDPRNRDWAPLATASTTTKSVTDANIHASSPVVNLNASLTQFVTNDRRQATPGH